MSVPRRQRACLPWLWLALSTWSASAAAQSFGEGLRSYDYESLAWGVLVALVGGLGRTALTLASDDVLILSVLRELWRDLVIAALAGAVTYVVIAAINSTPWASLPVPVSVLMLGAAGWARGAFFIWAEGAGKKLADRTADWAADKIKPTGLTGFGGLDAGRIDDTRPRKPGRFTRKDSTEVTDD